MDDQHVTILMSVLNELILVVITQHVQILFDHLHVHVMLDIVVMEQHVMMMMNVLYELIPVQHLSNV